MKLFKNALIGIIFFCTIFIGSVSAGCPSDGMAQVSGPITSLSINSHVGGQGRGFLIVTVDKCNFGLLLDTELSKKILATALTAKSTSMDIEIFGESPASVGWPYNWNGNNWHRISEIRVNQ